MFSRSMTFGRMAHLSSRACFSFVSRTTANSSACSSQSFNNFNHNSLRSNVKGSIRRRFSSSVQSGVAARSRHVDDFLQTPPAEFRIISGIQPTGGLHLGNYLGAIRQWVQLQSVLDTAAEAGAANPATAAGPSQNRHILFSVVDLHAMTVPSSREDLSKHCFELATALLGSGVDPEKATLFYQSQVPQIALLQWLLLCNTPIGWLNRMTQFKQKKDQVEEQHGKNAVGTGLFTYPVLMAADILLWK